VAPWAAVAGAAPLWLIYRVLDLPNVRARSRQDGLTELFTAQYLTESSTRELHRARRFNQSMTLLLVELDGLSQLNAEYGHQAGDAVLRGTAQRINYAKREYDLAARLGAGLFGVLLPDTDLAQAQRVAERIRRGTSDGRYQIPTSVEQTQLTVSIGGAVLLGGQGTVAELFAAAQAALAQSKRLGGNQIEFVVTQTISAPPAVSPAVEVSDIAAALSPALPAFEAEHAADAGSVSHRWGDFRGIVLLGLVALVVGVSLLWSTAELDWRRLVVLAGLATLAGLAFYFKPLTVALTLAVDQQRSPRLWTARYWRLWPMYLALGVTGLLVAYAYYRFGVIGAFATGAAAMLFRQLAHRYIEGTFESVRKLRVANEQLEHKAFHDPLTRLANRALFAERLGHAMVRAGDGSIAVLFIDLDNFKHVNDTLGHAVGDALLIATTARLQTCVRREDTIARLGGDEFTVLLEDMRDPSDAARMAERIGELLRTPFELDGQLVVVSSSIGVALDTDRSHAPDDLMREADMAMYRAKSAGRARYEIFDTGMGTRATERLELETALRRAVAAHELVLHYQPVVELATGALDAVETSLRWRHPHRGLLEQVEFQAVAEETGIMLDLGQWALFQACRDGARWQATRPGLVIQVKLSRAELDLPAFVALVAGALAASDLPAGCLLLEVPESVVADNGRAVAAVLDDLQRLGVRVALADVGAGVSSLAWLSRTPVDVLKMAPLAADSPALVRATVALGTALGMQVSACGVEHPDQAALLALFGCRQAQGSLYGRPQTARSIDDLLDRDTIEVTQAA
jgi:diguanylate cyclase (GGDEF)-like protein